MRRKPRWAPVGPVGGLAAELRKQLDRCRVDRAERKKMVALLRLCGADGVDQAVLQSQLVEALTKFCPPHAVFVQNDGGDWGYWAVVDDELPVVEYGSFLWPVADHPSADYENGTELYLVNPDNAGDIACGRLDGRGRFALYWSLRV